MALCGLERFWHPQKPSHFGYDISPSISTTYICLFRVIFYKRRHNWENIQLLFCKCTQWHERKINMIMESINNIDVAGQILAKPVQLQHNRRNFLKGVEQAQVFELLHRAKWLSALFSDTQSRTKYVQKVGTRYLWCFVLVQIIG